MRKKDDKVGNKNGNKKGKGKGRQRENFEIDSQKVLILG